MSDLSLILPWLSLAVGLIAVLRFYQDKRDRAIDEGRMKQTFEQLRKDIDLASIKISELERAQSCSDIDMAEVKRDVKHILESLNRIEDRLSKGA